MTPQEVARRENIALKRNQASRLLTDVVSVSYADQRRVSEILADVCAETGQSLREVLSPSRLRPVAYARQTVMYLAHREGISSTVIGAVLGRDHTTVLYGVRAVEARLKKSS